MYYFNLYSFFAETAQRHAADPALRYADHAVSYAALSEQAEHLAGVLQSQGCQRGDVIAIGHTKQPLSYALMLAGLKLGVPYVVIDVSSPVARNTRILAVSQPKRLFYDDRIHEKEMEELGRTVGCETSFLDEGLWAPGSTLLDPAKARPAALDVDGACIAYVMFTSGSTGDPKGVAVTHQNVLHFIAWGKGRFSTGPDTNFANLSPMYFDNSVFDFYVALFSGASLTPIPKDLMNQPYDLVTYVGKMECNLWFSVPSLLIYLTAMKAMKADIMPNLRHIIFGGEGYPKAELKKLYDEFEQATLVNVYGPTECTCICSAYDLSDEDFNDLEGLPTLGRLNQNFDYLILDADGHSAQEGELCLIGPNVASGYFNDPERTAASFISLDDPSRYMKRMYRTGDLVYEKEGQLFFHGRADNQIKHMGYRIELEEIEHALSGLPEVNQAAVLYLRGELTHGKIIGFAACQDEAVEANLLAGLGRHVPDYMVPSRIIVLKSLPRNPNGKVDRHQLKELL